MRVQQLLKAAIVVGLLYAASSAEAYTCGLELGQRVVLIVDQPDHPTLWAGMQGTIICFDEWDPWYPVIVSWDNWTEGHSSTWWCTTPVLPFLAGSLWWLACDEIEPIPDVPDLLDGGEQHRYFRPQNLVAGKANQLLEVGFQLRNGGRGDPTNVAYANIYLSQDDHITRSDYYLGNVNCYMTGGGSMNMVWKRTLPTTIPAGFYYVGWIIDPDNLVNDEYNESNNTVFLASYRLTVSSPAGQPSLEISAASGGKIASPGEGVFGYPAVKSLAVVASPDPNCYFLAWQGTAVEAGKVINPFEASTSVTVDAKYTLTAIFGGPHLMIDDFERFADPCNVISQVWVDGISFSEGKKGHTGNGTGAIVGNSEWPSPGNPTVHGGIQSMLFSYENGAKPWYSEVERTWGTLQNWDRTGADRLSIWYRGSPSNVAESLYVALRDCHGKTGFSVHPDVFATRRSEWSQWSIPLAEFGNQGVMLSRITKMCLGVGDRAKPIMGGHGDLYIDDIALDFEPDSSKIQ